MIRTPCIPAVTVHTPFTLVCFLVIILFSDSSVSAQDILIEWLITQNDEISDQYAALDYLELLAAHPVFANSADVKDFLRIPGITSLQAAQIVAVRKSKGNFISVDDIQKAGGIAGDWFALIKQFLTVKQSGNKNEVRIRQRNQRVIEKQAGYGSGAYEGSPLKNYSRMYVSLAPSVAFGALIEKDPGEKRLNDHTVGFIQYDVLQNRGKIIAGHYSLDFAQGLLFSRTSFFTKGQEPVYPISRRSSENSGFYSSLESEGFFGATGTLSIRNAQLILFQSRISRDAIASGTGNVTSIVITGLHRTYTERNYRDNLNEQLEGFRITYKQGTQLTIGFTNALIRYAPGLAPSNPSQYSSNFKGNRLRVTGTDFSYVKNNIECVGEAGFSDPGSYGFVTGLIWSEKNTAVGMLYRDYQYNFYSPFGNAFADKTTENRNERGMYIGIKHTINSQANAAFYIDVMKFPQPSASMPVSRQGYEYFSQIHYTLNPSLIGYIYWKRRTGVTKSDYTDAFGIARTYYEEENSNTIRIQGEMQTSQNIRLVSRFEVQSIGKKSERINFWRTIFANPDKLWLGRAVYSFERRFQTTAELVVFSSRKARFYQYEPDLPGVFTIKQYTGEGKRFAATLQYKGKHISLSAKYGITAYSDRSVIGSGTAAIRKNHMQDIGIQCDLFF